jgi:Cd2+/Zn2+-exporting ATPase
MHDLGVRPVVMLTGDHRLIAQRMADQLGVDEHFAELLPEQKVEHLRRLRAAHGEADRDPNDDTALAPRRLTGRRGLAVVGDGANDAPALATADIGIGMGGIGADAALEAADVVILRDNLAIVAWSIRLARRVQLIMLINLVFALAVIITLAAFALVGVIPMGVGVIGHEGSTLIVVANSLQLLAFRGPGGSGE